MTWKQDRDWLRAQIKTGVKGIEATMLYVLLSHMRGKIHMHWYQKWHGGWNISAKAVKSELPKGFLAAYKDYADLYYGRAIIDTLADQAAWIARYVIRRFGQDDLKDIAKRVLDGKWEGDNLPADVPIAQR